MVLTESDLNEIEKIPAKQIPADSARAEGDLQLERPEIRVGELN